MSRAKDEEIAIEKMIVGEIEGMGCVLTKLGDKTYRSQNGNIIFFKYSTPHEQTSEKIYWFGIPKRKFESYPVESLYVLLICEKRQQTLVIPGGYLSDLLKNMSMERKGNFKIHILERYGRFEIRLLGGRREDATRFLNRFELIVKT
ncbi:MAG: hypothetical protein AB1742_05525 [bacterium]